MHLFESGKHWLGLAQGHREAKVWPTLCVASLEQRQFIHKNRLDVQYTTLTELLTNEQTRAILQNHIPELLAHPELAFAMNYSLQTLANFSQGVFTQEMLDGIDADLAKIKV